MAFNFLPSFREQNSDHRREEEFNNAHLASLLQPPQRVTNYNLPPLQPVSLPSDQRLRFPKWQHMPWNAAPPEPIRPSLQHYEQENHCGIARGSQAVNMYTFSGDYKFATSDQAHNDLLGCKVTDEMWLENWLSRRRTNTSVHPAKGEASETLKVSQARGILKKCCVWLHTLEKCYQELHADKDKLKAQIWQEKWIHVNKIQEEVADALANISAADNMRTVKKTLIKRIKKRLVQKRCKSFRQINQKKNLLQRQEQHENINAWLKNMEEVVEKSKREESLKHEADVVLGEVTRKKAEARRQITLLSVLLKLRQIRAQRTQPVSAESSARFSRVIEHLEQLWQEQLRGYNVEEQGLRVMLEEAVEERTQSYDKQAIAEWDRLLFGVKPYVKFRNFYLAAENNMEAFVAIRKCWDKYLAPSDAVMSSSIPVGWVLPTNSSSSSWEKHLKPHY